MYRHIVLVHLFTQFWQNGMGCRCDRHIWSDHRIVANINMGVIDTGQMIICINHISKMAVMSPKISIEGSLYIYPFSAIPKHTLQQFLPFICLGWFCQIIITDLILINNLFFHNLLISWKIKFSRVHLRLHFTHFGPLSFSFHFSDWHRPANLSSIIALQSLSHKNVQYLLFDILPPGGVWWEYS